MSRTDEPGENTDAEAPTTEFETDLPDPDAPDAKWMYRDDAFLLEEDREYVLRDEGWSWRSWVAPLAFGVLVAFVVADAMLVGAATAAGADPLSVLAPVVAEVGLGGLVLANAAAAMLLVLLPGVTGGRRSTLRAGGLAYVLLALCLVAAGAVVSLSVS